MTTEYDVVPAESEQLDQLQRDETLVDRGVADVLDEGYTTSEHWSAAQGFGNTPAEMRRRERIDQRVLQEEPDVAVSEDDWNPQHEKRQVGSQRAGRLVDSRHGYDKKRRGSSECVAEDVGFSGGAASAEEAAMHIIDEEDLDRDDD